MDGAQHIPEIAYLRRVISSVQIRRSRPPSLVPNPSPRLGFRARHRLHCRRGSGVPGGSSSSSTVPPLHEIDTLGGFLFEWWSIFDARTREKPREGGATSSVDELTHLHSPVPNGEQLVETEGSVDASEEEEVAEDSEDDARDQDYHEEEEEEEPESPVHKERRSKLQEDPEHCPTRTAASSARPAKRDRAETPESAEKAARPAAKLRKALPRMKIPVPVASMAATSVTSPPLGVDEAMEDDTADAATSQRENIDVEDDDDTPHVITLPAASIAPSPALGMPQSTSAITMPPPSAPPTITAPIVTSSGIQSTGPAVIVPTPPASAPPTTRTIMCPLYRVPEDQVGAAKEAMIQSKLMMERTKQAYEASRLAYDASSSLEANIRKACEISSHYAELEQEKTNLAIDLEATKNLLQKSQSEVKTLGETVKKALEDKDAELALAQKTAKEKTEEATRKLAGMEQLEKELNELKKEKSKWSDKYNNLKERKAKLEQLFEKETGRFFAMLDEFCHNFEEETEALEPQLDPTKSLTGDAAMMNTYRLEARLQSVQKYIGRLKDAIKGIDEELWAEDTKLYDLEPMMTRLEEVPKRVQAWKKSAARCGADVALSLVRVHLREAREEKLKNLQVVNTPKLQFQDFLETFLTAATRIADGIDLDSFVEPASP